MKGSLLQLYQVSTLIPRSSHSWLMAERDGGMSATWSMHPLRVRQYEINLEDLSRMGLSHWKELLALFLALRLSACTSQVRFVFSAQAD